MRRLSCLCVLACVVGLGCGSGSDEGADQSAGDVEAGRTGYGGAAGTGGGRGTGGLNAADAASSTGGARGTGASTDGGASKIDGSVGSGGTPTVDAAVRDVVVAACDSLGADGTWQMVGPPEVLQGNWQAQGVAVDPLHAGTLYAGFKNGWSSAGLWKSTDCGANWIDVAKGRNGSTVESGSQWEILVDPVSSDVYASSGYGGWGLYRSTNGGVDWDDVRPTIPGTPGLVQGFAMDPADHNHVLITFHANCTDAYAPMCLAETTDGAATWRAVKGPTQGWGEGAGPVVIGGSTWLYGAPFGGLYYTNDSGATWEKVVDYPGCYAELVIVPGKYYLGCEANNGIQTSADGHVWTHLANSPQANGFSATTKYLYADFQNDTTNQPIHRAPLNDPTGWTTVTTPTIAQGGHITYDPHHRVLYVGSWSSGVWRVVTD